VPKPHTPASERDAYTVDEFCHRHMISRGSYYNMRAIGIAPTEMRAMGRVLISRESAEAWRRAREANTAEGRSHAPA
jgi:hypothetical protein